LAVLIVLCGGFYIYTLNYYRADSTAGAAMAASEVRIEYAGNDIVFFPAADKDISTALIFYPGGKVEYTAYVPLLERLARQGLTSVLVKMPFNLAVFNINAADRVYALLPEISHWYIGGHSLGGAMASSYVGKNAAKVGGLILLGAYPVNSATLPMLVVYGSEDVNLDKSKLAGVKNIVEIAGGNHAHFGNYGEQAGDGTAAITREDQQAQTVKAIMDFIGDKK
jgi:predicted esterase